MRNASLGEFSVAVNDRDQGQSDSRSRNSVSIAPQQVLRGRDKLVFLLLSINTLIAVAVFTWHWFDNQPWKGEWITFGAWSFIIVIVTGTHLSRWALLPCMRKPPPAKVGAKWRVAVATTFVPGAEPLEMLEENIDALIALDGPHDTWVLDEGGDYQVQSLCRRKGALYFTRKHLSHCQTLSGTFAEGSKHGNYNAWLFEVARSKYDIVAAFDPDHVPTQSYLTSVVGYFEDMAVGYVQVAQVYGNQSESWVARGAAEETYDFFSTIQMASYGLGYPVIIGGHNVHRLTALMDIGGFGAHDADDCYTTILYREAGWKGIYVPKVLAIGRCPEYCAAYLTQQRRWARSILDIKLRLCPGLSATSPLPARAMSFLHGVNYLLKGLIPVLLLTLICIACVQGNAPSFATSTLIVPISLLLAAMTLNEAFRQRFFLAPDREGGIHWRAALLRWAKWPQMALALSDVVLNRKYSYSITDKSNKAGRHLNWLWPHVLACATIVVCWLVGRQRSSSETVSLDVAVGAVIAITIALMLLESVPKRKSVSES